MCVDIYVCKSPGALTGLLWAQRGLEGSNPMSFFTAAAFSKGWSKALIKLGLVSLSRRVGELQRHLHRSPETPRGGS